MRIVVPTASMVAGTVAASLTFATMSYAAQGAVSATGVATNIAGYLAGRGVNLVFGPVSGYLAEQATREFGDQILTPVVRTGSRQTAYLTSAAVGAAVIAVSTILIHASTWIYQKGHKAMCQYLKQTPVEIVSNLTEVENDTMLVSIDEVTPPRASPLPV